jgi:sporulation protein YlmC with PRC-barrel domain
MRTIPIAAVAALAILAGAASAQTPATPNAPRSAAPGITAAPIQRQAAQNPLTQEDIANIDGTAVYGSDDSKIGHVSTVLMDPQTKKIDRLVVTSGGVLGVGGHRVAIPVDRFSWDADKGALKLPENVASVKSMPEWVEGAETATGSSQPPRSEKQNPPASAGDSDSR